MNPNTKSKAEIVAAIQDHDKKESSFFTPRQLATRWTFHPESIRRLLRKGQIESVIVGRRRLIPMSELMRIENEGRVSRAS